MKQTIRDDLKAIALVLDQTAPGIFARDAARNALERIEYALAAAGFELTQKEFLAKDLRALAKGKQVVTDLAKAVEARIANTPVGCEYCTCESCGGSKVGGT